MPLYDFALWSDDESSVYFSMPTSLPKCNRACIFPYHISGSWNIYIYTRNSSVNAVFPYGTTAHVEPCPPLY
jgi:hypothetical protein